MIKNVISFNCKGQTFRSLRHINDPERKPKWSINQLKPELTDTELAEDLALFFIKISDEFIPLDTSNLPVTFGSPFQEVLPHVVATRIRAAKKPPSMVEGDILPVLLNECADLLAIPATRIFNICLQSKTWPAEWRMESQTPIPKKGNPSTYDELRNITCTNFLSKIMETFVMDKLQQEVKLKYSQFGGVKCTGTTHFLAETYQKNNRMFGRWSVRVVNFIR